MNWIHKNIFIFLFQFETVQKNKLSFRKFLFYKRVKLISAYFGFIWLKFINSFIKKIYIWVSRKINNIFNISSCAQHLSNGKIKCCLSFIRNFIWEYFSYTFHVWSEGKVDDEFSNFHGTTVTHEKRQRPHFNECSFFWKRMTKFLSQFLLMHHHATYKMRI